MKKISYLFAFLLLGFQACTDHFEELNTNPAGFPSLAPGIQLAKIQADLSGQREEAWYNDLGITSPLVQHIGGSWWSAHGSQYRIVEKSHWYTFWESTYPRDVKNIQNLVDNTAEDPEMVNYNAAGRIMRVYIFSRLTDVYGDIPYSEAAKGYTEGIFLPKYDRQEDIYTDFFKELDEAVAAFDPAQGPVNGDLFFGGDVSKWIKFGNSLRLRLGMRLTEVKPAEAQKQVEAAIAGGVMESNADNAMLLHMEIAYIAGGEESRGNGRSQAFQATPNSENYRLAGALVEQMVETDDPRLYIFGGAYLDEQDPNYPGVDIRTLNADFEPIGLENGAYTWDLWEDYGELEIRADNGTGEPTGETVFIGHSFKFLQPSKYVSALNAPYFHMTYSEVELLKAEAALRGWSGVSNVQEHFEKGVTAGVEMATLYPGVPAVPQEEINELLANYEPFPTTFEGAMEAIHEQLWVTLFLNGVEAYSNYRRTGYPDLEPFQEITGGNASGTGGVMPRRFFYPESEALTNSSNYQEAVDRLGGNDWLDRVWWDVE